GAAFVDIVAGVKNEVELLLGDAPERGKVAVLVVIAATDGEPQPIDRSAGRRRGFRPCGLADFIAGAKAIPVLAARLEAGDLDVHAVSELRPRRRGPFLDDVLEPPVARDLPVDVDDGHRHAAA